MARIISLLILVATAALATDSLTFGQVDRSGAPQEQPGTTAQKKPPSCLGLEKDTNGPTKQVLLEPVPGLHARAVVPKNLLNQLGKLPEVSLQERYKQQNRRVQQLNEEWKEDFKKNAVVATYTESEIGYAKQDLITTFVALHEHGYSTAPQYEEVFSIATDWPSVACDVKAEFSRELGNRAEQALDLAKSEKPQKTFNYSKDGKRYIITDLVLGTVNVSYDPSITPGRPTQLTLQFEPQSVLNDKVLGKYLSNEFVSWHARAEHHAQGVSSQYDLDLSGYKPEERVLDLSSNSRETWEWTVKGGKGFEKDVSDLIFYLGYQTKAGEKAERDIWREKINWAEKYQPGVLDKLKSWIAGFYGWVLGFLVLLNTITGITANRLTRRVRKLELQQKAGPAKWIFGYGSLIWNRGQVLPDEVREGFLEGWHREWGWISSRRHGAPTCSLAEGGHVKGVFLRLNVETAERDLEELRRRERKDSERTIADVPHPGSETYFWMMGSNLNDYTELCALAGDELLCALAHKARQIERLGPDGVSASDYIRRVHEFDPEDELTATLADFLDAPPQ